MMKPTLRFPIKTRKMKMRWTTMELKTIRQRFGPVNWLDLVGDSRDGLVKIDVDSLEEMRESLGLALRNRPYGSR
jgi:hypothetical protein